MSTRIICITVGGLFLFLLSACLTAHARAGDDVSSQDTVAVILNTIIAEGADKSIADLVHRDDDFARDFVDFLNRDFRTNVFGRHTEIACADILYTADGKENHFGFAVIAFSNPKDLDSAYKAALSTGRHNFKVKVLTVFRVFRLNLNFIILYSESPRSNHTIRIFNNLAISFTRPDGR